MSIFSEKGRGWKFDFILNGQRHTSKYFRTKTAAKEAEAKKREELLNPAKEEVTPIAMGFSELVNLRLDHIKAYNSPKHYQDTLYSAKKWIKLWGSLTCEQISTQVIRNYLLQRRKVSPVVANKELRYLRSLFNYGLKEGLLGANPTDKLRFFPLEKKIRYVPGPEDIFRVIEITDQETQDYLWTMWETLGRMSEINRLTWEDVNLNSRFVILYTRKKRGGSMTPRKVAMTDRLFSILEKRYALRDQLKPWVFWHRYRSRKDGQWKEGPYIDRKKFMKTLCQKASVKYFRFHALRHSGASIMDNNNVPLGAIQEILGHESRGTTEIYLHSLSGAAQKAMQVYERVKMNSHSNSHSNAKRVADENQQPYTNLPILQ
jgi:integrase